MSLIIGPNNFWTRRSRRVVARQIARSGAKEVLDLACGTGEETAYLYVAGLNVTAVNRDEATLEIAKHGLTKVVINNKIKVSRKTNRHNRAPFSGHIDPTTVMEPNPPRFICAEGDNLPLDDDTFDAVTLVYGVHFLQNRRGCLREVMRVMQPGGTFYVVDFKFDLIADEMKAAGFKDVQVRRFLLGAATIYSGTK